MLPFLYIFMYPRQRMYYEGRYRCVIPRHTDYTKATTIIISPLLKASVVGAWRVCAIWWWCIGHGRITIIILYYYHIIIYIVYIRHIIIYYVIYWIIRLCECRYIYIYNIIWLRSVLTSICNICYIIILHAVENSAKNIIKTDRTTLEIISLLQNHYLL